MKHKSQTLTAVELFERLQRDEPLGGGSVTLIGMVKKSQGKERSVQFAPGASCSHWVTIPLEFIEDVELLKTVACKDHSHPLVRLTLKASRTPEAKILAALLEGVQSEHEGGCDVGYGDTAVAFRARLGAVDEWGDPICGPGMRKRCYVLPCPDRQGWCQECRCEPRPIRDPEGFMPWRMF